MIQARASKSYCLRLMLIGLLFAGWGVWSVYDGTVTYPRQREIFQQYENLQEEGRLDKWPTLMAEHGYPETPKDRSSRDILTQFIMAAITLPIGLLFLVGFVRYRARWIRVSEDGATLERNFGPNIAFSQVTSLDNTRWPSKGISMLKYKPNGQEKRLVLDNWKFDQHPMDAIIYQVQEKLERSQIVGEPIPTPKLLKPEGESDDGADSAGGEQAGAGEPIPGEGDLNANGQPPVRAAGSGADGGMGSPSEPTERQPTDPAQAPQHDAPRSDR